MSSSGHSSDFGSSAPTHTPLVEPERLAVEKGLSTLRRGSRSLPSFDRYFNSVSFVPMTEDEGKAFVTLLLTNVQKVRSNLAEARTGYMMDTGEWERKYGSFDEDEMLQEYVPRLFGPNAVVGQLVELALADHIEPVDVFNIMLVLCDDHVLKVHLQDFGVLRRRLPDMCGWAAETAA
jgi:hypothetical protein